MSGGGKLRQLSALQAKRTLANRFVPTVDRLRQMLTNFGLRPYNVFLTWTKWGGQERGEGNERIFRRIPLLPNPEVQDLTSISLQPYAAGILPVGSVRLTKISARYAQDLLMGLVLPCDPQANFDSQVVGGPPINLTEIAIATESVPDPYEFFYEIVEDGRSNDGREPPRARFRPMAAPFRKAGEVEWNILLERVSEDMARDATPQGDDE